jgi:putative flippase GtrA
MDSYRTFSQGIGGGVGKNTQLGHNTAMKQLIIGAFDDWYLVGRYVAVGIFAVVFDIGLLYTLADVFGMWYLAAAVIAFVVTFLVAFTLQKHWTFRDSAGGYMRQGASYFIIGVMNLVLDTVFLYIAVDVLHIWYLGAQVVIMGGLAFVSFLANRHITFKLD